MKKLAHIPLERGGVRVGGNPRLGAVGTVMFSLSLWGFSCHMVAPTPALGPPHPDVVHYAGVG